MNTHTAETAAQLAATLVDELLEGLSVNALETIAELRQHLDAAERTAVKHARQAGHSWEVIGEAAGISKQAAHKKFAHVDRVAARELLERQPMPGEQPLPLDEPTPRRPLVVIPCGASKRKHAAPAAQLYTGQQFALALEAAQALAAKMGGADVRVLSAEHGLVELDQVLEPYDHKLSRTDLAGLLPDRVARQLDELDPVMVHTMTPKLYTELLEVARARRAADDAGMTRDLFAGCSGIGQQRAVLARVKAGAWA